MSLPERPIIKRCGVNGRSDNEPEGKCDLNDTHKCSKQRTDNGSCDCLPFVLQEGVLAARCCQAKEDSRHRACLPSEYL